MINESSHKGRKRQLNYDTNEDNEIASHIMWRRYKLLLIIKNSKYI